MILGPKYIFNPKISGTKIVFGLRKFYPTNIFGGPTNNFATIFFWDPKFSLNLKKIDEY